MTFSSSKKKEKSIAFLPLPRGKPLDTNINELVKLNNMMNFRKSLLLVFFTLIAINAPAHINSDEPITFEDLPQAAQLLIKANFTNLTVTRASYNMSSSNKNYEVAMSDNTRIVFDEMGNWTEILCENSPIPTHLIPESIFNYVTVHFPTTTINEIEKENGHYEVTLSNHLELTFDSNYNVIESDSETEYCVED